MVKGHPCLVSDNGGRASSFLPLSRFFMMLRRFSAGPSFLKGFCFREWVLYFVRVMLASQIELGSVFSASLL